MRKPLAIFLCTTTAFSTAGWAIARPSHPRLKKSITGRAAVLAPAKMPRRDKKVAGAYGYQTGTALAAKLGAAPKQGHPGQQSTGSGASTSVTVTATILPTRIVVVRYGKPAQIWSNATTRRYDATVYVFRRDQVGGPAIKLTPRLWALTRAKLRTASRVNGRIA